MKSYLSLIPISAKLHRRQNRMTILCILTSVFLVTAVFSMVEMTVRQETDRLVTKHGIEEVMSLFRSQSFKSLIPVAGVLSLLVLCAGVLMIAGSMNSNVAQRTQFFGMMRCLGMSRRQVIRYVISEALNWCRSAIPAGLLAGTVATWILCAVLKYAAGGEWADIPQFGISLFGIVSGTVVGILTVLIAAVKPAKKAADVTPVSALSGSSEAFGDMHSGRSAEKMHIEKALGIHHASCPKKNLFLMTGSFALSIILFLSFSVMIDLVNCLMPQSASAADIEIYSECELIDSSLLPQLNGMDGCKRAFGRRSVFDVDAVCDDAALITRVDVISFGCFDLDALKKDGMLERGCELEKVVNSGGALVISDEDVGKGSVFSVFGTQLSVAGRLKYDPFSFDGTTGGKTTLIVSNETFERMTGISGYSLILVQLSGAVSDENVDAMKALTGVQHKFIDNREDDTHGTYVVFIVCVYSFLVIIALVTVLNIVNSISMSVSARTKQYGVMRAVGMSEEQLARMIKAEALTYAVLGCATGLLLGLLFSRWLYGVLVTAHFPYAHWQLPLGELAVVAVFFVLSVAAGVRAPIRRINSMSITENISRI